MIAKGEVQRVGYRDEVQRIARKLGIKGYVENIKPYDVKIVAKGEEKKLEEFIKAIKIKRFPIEVESLDVKWERATDEFEYFEIKRGSPEEELGERLDAAAKYLFRSVELSERSVALGERSVEIGEKMLEKQDKMLEMQKQTLEKQDQMLEKQDQTIKAIEKLDADMNQKFDSLDEKYGEISKNLVRAVEGIEKLLERSERDRANFEKSINRLADAILKLAEKLGG